MVDQQLVDILVKKIRNGETNPKTEKPFKFTDIKDKSIKAAVSAILKGDAHEK